MVKECALSTGKLPLGGLPRNSVVRINDRPEMTSAVKLTVDVKHQFNQPTFVRKGILFSVKLQSY